MQIPDISKLRWQLNVALMAVAFSIISLIYNDKYIYYGFLTFIFAVISHFFGSWFDFMYKDDNKKGNLFLIVQSIFIIVWVILLLRIRII